MLPSPLGDEHDSNAMARALRDVSLAIRLNVRPVGPHAGDASAHPPSADAAGAQRKQ